MRKNQLEMFATPNDFIGVLRAAENQQALSYAVAEWSETGAVRSLDTSADVLNAMSAPSDAPLTFLAVNRMDGVHVREVPQKKGGSRYIVDQLSAPRSVVLRPGGMADENTVVAGQIGTTSEDPASLMLFSMFSKAVRRQFVKVKSYWVGPEALRILDDGGRLAANVKSGPEYDLKR